MSGVCVSKRSWATVSPADFCCETSSLIIVVSPAKDAELFSSTAVAGFASSVKEVSCSSSSFSASLRVGLDLRRASLDVERLIAWSITPLLATRVLRRSLRFEDWRLMLDWRLGVAETLRVRCKGQVALCTLSCSIGGWWPYRRGGEVDGVLNRVKYESGDELKTPATTGFSTLYWRRCFASRGGLSISRLVSDDRSLYVDAESLSCESTEEPLGFDMAWRCLRGRTDGLRTIWLMDRWN
jgi:hypothetical protein